MEETLKDEKLMQTYCYTDYGAFFVSTIHRPSSASMSPSIWYYETFAWEIVDIKTNERGKIIADNSGAESIRIAIEQHQEVCRELIDKGKFIK